MKKLIWITFCTMISLWLTLPGFSLAEDSDQINTDQTLEFPERWQNMIPEQREKTRQRWQNQPGDKRSGDREGRRYNSQGNKKQRRENHQ